LLLLLVPLQIFLGDQHGLNTLEHQPAKLAAIEGDFKTETQELSSLPKGFVHIESLRSFCDWRD
jgi:cytochrome bd-type quinol oxidase subunit 1